MKIKNFPLAFTEEQLNRIGRAAEKAKKSKKDFMYEAIENAVKITEKKGE